MKNPAKSTQDELHHIAIGISVVFIILSVASVSLTILCDIYFNRNFGVNLVEVDVQNLSLIIQKSPPRDIIISAAPGFDEEIDSSSGTTLEKVQSFLNPKVKSYIAKAVSGRIEANTEASVEETEKQIPYSIVDMDDEKGKEDHKPSEDEEPSILTINGININLAQPNAAEEIHEIILSDSVLEKK